MCTLPRNSLGCQVSSPGHLQISADGAEATDLSKTFADQGLKIRVRKDPRRMLLLDPEFHELT
jgi:hypothetical protein